MAIVFTIMFAGILAAASPQTSLTRPDVSNLRVTRDLSNYKTYAWNKSQSVPTEKMANHLRIINAIQENMKQRGFRIDTVRPDVRIQYRLELRQRVRGNTTQQRSVWDDSTPITQVDFSRIKEAHFSLQLVEAESNFLLWQGEGSYPVGTPDRDEMQINEAVADLFKRYPAQN